MTKNEEIIKTRSVTQQLLDFVDRSPWKNKYSVRLQRLMDRAEQPCELAIAGRVKAGKSSFLNALLGDDLAMVGTTETTATINFFRYGTPEDTDRPIRVIWEDGREEYHSRAFLDSLQGNSKEVLEKAKGINRLEYLIPNEILRNVTLVDTPGTDAIVDEHEQRTDDYFSREKEELRKKHGDQSKILTERADAVVYITERVPTKANKTFLTKYLGMEGCGSSAMNAIGVMTKIDLMENVTGEDIQRMSRAVAEEMNKELNDVLPVSAGIYRALQKLRAEGRLVVMWQKLRQIPDNFFDTLLANDKRFLTEEKVYAKRCEETGQVMLTPEERQALLGEMDWRVFVVIARNLYRYPLEEAERSLSQYSGMEQVKAILEKHFFRRSRVIRCSAIAKEMHGMLDDMGNNGLYDLRKEIGLRTRFETYINSHPSRYQDAVVAEKLLGFVAKHSCTQKEIDLYQQEIIGLIRQVELLQKEFRKTSENSEALLLLGKCASFFTVEQVAELERLFGKKYEEGESPLEVAYIARRQNYWRGREMMMSDNPDIRRIIQQAVVAYGTKLS